MKPMKCESCCEVPSVQIFENCNNGGVLYVLSCSDCEGGREPIVEWEEGEAIKAWNKRELKGGQVNEDVLQREVDRLRTLIKDYCQSCNEVRDLSGRLSKAMASEPTEAVLAWVESHAYATANSARAELALFAEAAK